MNKWIKLFMWITIPLLFWYFIFPVLLTNLALLHYRNLSLPYGNPDRNHNKSLYEFSKSYFQFFPSVNYYKKQMSWITQKVNWLEKNDLPKDDSVEFVVNSFLRHEIKPQSVFEKELMAYNCLDYYRAKPDEKSCQCLLESQSQLADIFPVEDLLVQHCGWEGKQKSGSIYLAQYINELNNISLDVLTEKLLTGDSECENVLDFMRRLISRYGYDSLNQDITMGYLTICSTSQEAWYYQARVSEINHSQDEARDAYGKSADPMIHPEAILGQIEFFAKNADCSEALKLSSDFLNSWPDSGCALNELESFSVCLIQKENKIPCKSENFTIEAEDMFSGEPGDSTQDIKPVFDSLASGQLARKGNVYSGWLIAGPWITLPIGNYAAIFFIRAEDILLWQEVARIDVISDDPDWRGEYYSKVIYGYDMGEKTYQGYDVYFTHSGEGLLQFRVKALTLQPVWVDKVEIVNDELR
jgi:hypothetical protein